MLERLLFSDVLKFKMAATLKFNHFKCRFISTSFVVSLYGTISQSLVKNFIFSLYIENLLQLSLPNFLSFSHFTNFYCGPSLMQLVFYLVFVP
jgi:hypothetical protein